MPEEIVCQDDGVMNQKDLQEIEKKILGETYVSNETEKNLMALCGFGSRFAGTPSEKQAVDYILGKMREYGLDNPHTEKVEYLGWKRGTSVLEVMEPEYKELECIGLPWSPSTPSGGVEAELLNLGHGTHVDYALHKTEVAKKIVLTTSFTPSWMRFQNHCEKLTRAEDLGAVGFIYAKNEPGLLCETGVATWSWPVSFGRIARFPAVGTSKEVAEYLGRLQHKGKVKVRIKANHTSGPALTWNVVGEIIGEKRPEEVIIAGAHFDGHDIAVGASDDAAGTCVVLEAARLLARHKKGFKRSVRFIAFPAEEVGDFGSAGYVLQHLDEMNNIRFMFNLDSGPENTTRPGLLIAGWPDSIPFFKKMASDMGQPIPLGVGFGSLSDHVPFALRGIHTAWLRGGGFFSGWRSTHGWGHTKADTEDKVDIRDMREAVGTIARVLFRMATVEELPFSRKSQEEIKAMLKEYSYDKLLETMACYPAWLK